MVRTAPNTISRRTLITNHPLQSPRPSSSNDPVNRNNINRFFDQGANTSQQTPSHNHDYAYSSLSHFISTSSRSPTAAASDPLHARVPPVDHHEISQESSSRSASKSHFIGVVVPRYSPLMEESSELRKRHHDPPAVDHHKISPDCSSKSSTKSHFIRVLVPRYSVKESSELRKRHKNLISKLKLLQQATLRIQAAKTKTRKSGWSKKKAKIGERIDAPIEHDSWVDGASGEMVTEEEFQGLLDLNQVDVDHETFRNGDAVFVVPDEEDIPDESEPDRYWLALIKEIKKRRKSNDHHHSQYHSRRIPTSEVFLKVEWFYRLDDFEKSKKSNLVFQKIAKQLKKIGFRSPNGHDPNSADFRFQDKELIRTDHSSIIHLKSLAGKADVYKFDDQLPPNHPTQPVFEHCCGQGVNQMNHSIDDKVVKSIGVEGYYYRIHLQFNPQQKSHDHQKNRIHSKALLRSINLTQTDKFGCKCSKPYDPSEEVMIFDLKRTQWVHVSCLTARLEEEEQRSRREHLSLTFKPDQRSVAVKKKKGRGMTDIDQIKSSLLVSLDSLHPGSDQAIPSDFFFNRSSCCILRGFQLSLAGQIC
ncbi:hypothetical protein PCANC_02094 [Puccinia coronata f. sp. avenae]|uniref:BAH domain-containing protein n=1 Tax=Puccinia coronata f. sp. avenae TaxID=200324 RepID=A0A2N5VZS9_9BASI|nr:hypothetical protein PCANC_02094 [Puccinia coronata f. sp. avenae]